MVAKKTKSKKIVNQLYYNDDQRRLAKLVSGFSFDMFIMLVILADAVVLGLMTLPTMDFYFKNDLFLMDRIFMGIFIAEMFLKIFALKGKFFKTGWNVFDLVVVAISSVPLMNAFIVLRSFRLFRLFRYMNYFPKLKNLIEVFLTLLPYFAAFLAIFAVFFYMFAIIAVNLYGHSFAAFGTLSGAFFTLLQIVTLDGWASSIARTVMEIYPNAGFFFSLVLLFSFLLTISFVVLAIAQIQHCVCKEKQEK